MTLDIAMYPTIIVTIISQRLGHPDINMTLSTYSHMIHTDEDKEIFALETLES